MTRKTLQMQATLSPSQRQTILGREAARNAYVPRVRAPNETPGITYSNISTVGTYRTGDGDPYHQPVRPGAAHAAGLPSRGS